MLKLLEGGSGTGAEKATLVLNAFSTKNGIVLAERTVDVKTNEIHEIGKLLDDLDIIREVLLALTQWAVKKRLLKKSLRNKRTIF